MGNLRVLDFDLHNIKKKNLVKLRDKLCYFFKDNLVDRISVLDNVISGMLKDIPLSRAIIKLYRKKKLKKKRQKSIWIL